MLVVWLVHWHRLIGWFGSRVSWFRGMVGWLWSMVGWFWSMIGWFGSMVGRFWSMVSWLWMMDSMRLGCHIKVTGMVKRGTETFGGGACTSLADWCGTAGWIGRAA